MTARPTGGRSGITLTEILISILIMGVGLVSLATLFPVGLMRLRQAQRATRSTLLTETAMGDIAGRNLFNRQSFLATGFYADTVNGPPYIYFDPWIQDTPLPDASNQYSGTGNPYLDGHVIPSGVYRGGGLDGGAHNPPTHPVQPYFPGSGLPVAYDPLWWSQVNAAGGIAPNSTAGQEGRFGSGLGFIRDDPDGDPPSAHGLQRVTNFAFTAGGNALAVDTFTSRDDPVLNADSDEAEAGSPVLPFVDPSGSMIFDWSFTWMFTGRRADVSNGTIYEGDVVVLHNRPLAYDPTPDLAGGTTYVPAGERVVEAIFAYGTTVNSWGFSPNDQTVLLRWPASQPDPDVAVGGWIADVTYERLNARDVARFYTGTAGRTEFYPGQRCHWYRVIKVNAAEGEVAGTSSEPADDAYRRMILTIDSPVRAKTQMTSGGAPVHLNAALVSPYVVNVYSKVFYAH